MRINIRDSGGVITKNGMGNVLGDGQNGQISTVLRDGEKIIQVMLKKWTNKYYTSTVEEKKLDDSEIILLNNR